MNLSGYRRILRLPMLLSCSAILVVLLAACGGGGTTSTSTPTPKPTATPSPTATPLPPSGTTTYTGKGYTLTYTQGWKVTTSSNETEFSDPTNSYHFIVAVTPNTTGVPASTLLPLEVRFIEATLKNTKTVSWPPTTTMGGDTWQEKAIEGTPTTGKSTTVELIFMSDNHPNNKTPTTNFTVVYGTYLPAMSTAYSLYFQQMLASFKFTS